MHINGRAQEPTVACRNRRRRRATFFLAGGTLGRHDALSTKSYSDVSPPRGDEGTPSVSGKIGSWMKIELWARRRILPGKPKKPSALLRATGKPRGEAKFTRRSDRHRTSTETPWTPLGRKPASNRSPPFSSPAASAWRSGCCSAAAELCPGERASGEAEAEQRWTAAAHRCLRRTKGSDVLNARP